MQRHPFDLLMELEPEHIRLDCAALHLARDAYPQLDLPRYLRQLDDWADQVAAQRPGLAANLRYAALRRVLVDENGLSGNSDDYYNPENCYLNRVLDTRRGIPITLAVVWIEVARRLKWPVAGVALPGHFIIRFDDAEHYLLVDPFHAGRSLTVADCSKLVEARYGTDLRFSRRFLKPISSEGIVARLLRNLRNAYLVDNNLPRVATILQRMTAVEPANMQHVQELAAVYCQQGDIHAACRHLRAALRRLPNGAGQERLRARLRRLELTLAALN